MTTISPESLAKRLRSGPEPLLLDIRSPAAFDAWHIPNSVNVDVLDELRDDPDEARAAFRDLPSGEEIVTVCAAGVSSRTATDLLRDMGYEAKTLEEGMAGWSRVHRSAPVPVDIPGTLVQVARPGKGCLSYLLISDGEAAVFDPSQYAAEYETLLVEYDAELVSVYETHAHADHLSGARDLARTYDVPYHLHPDDAIAVDAVPIGDGETFSVGRVAVDVLHTPGHSPGGVTYDVEGRALLTGDTLFHGSVGRVELGATVGLADADVELNAERLYRSIQRILDRRDDALVLPSHHPGAPQPPVFATLEEITERNRDLRLDRSAFVARLTSDTPDLPPNVRRIKRANVGLESVDDDDRTSIELGPNRCAVE